MCGIVGMVGVHGTKVCRHAIDAASRSLHKRGPDDFGEWFEGDVGLGHRRLAILDVSSAGHQPMVSPDGRYVLVYNGEIYNFRELRKAINSDGSAWKSESDTEMILAAYAKWGVHCVERFHGMFAFAIWDRAERTLYAARDRMGVKPLYYHSSPQGMVFGSRPRALYELRPDISDELDYQGLRYYLELGYFPAPHTVHASMRKLPPAHYLLFKQETGALEVSRYWRFDTIATDRSLEGRSEADLLDELDGIISRNVKSRMISDVPLGAFLSGGIDSSLVVAMMARHSESPVKTFTIGFDEKAYDESSHAQAVAEELGTDHHCEMMRVDDLLGLLPTFREEYDEPFFDSSAFPTMAVSRLARRHVTVSLSGDGGDEVFGGYHYYEIVKKLAPFYSMPESIRTVVGSAVGLIPNHKAKLLAGALKQHDLAGAFGFIRSIIKDYHGILGLDAIPDTRGFQELFSEKWQSFPKDLEPSEKGMRMDAFYTLPDDYLQKVDVGSMAFSLESRDPLLDQELVEWGMRLPLKWKLRNGTNKYLLRQLSYRYVSKRILDRPKQGFAVPIDKWLRGPLREWAMERIEDRDLFQRIPLDQSKVRNLLQLHLTGKRNTQSALWAILMLLDFVDAHRSRQPT